MDYTKLEVGTPLIISIERNNEAAEFETAFVACVDNCILTKAIEHEGKMVSFSSSEIKKELRIIDTAESKVYAWRDIEIKAGIYKKTEKVHLIYINGPAATVNRRNAYRQYLGLPAICEYNRWEMESVVIRDISNNGIGILAETDDMIEVDNTYKISFTDEEENVSFRLIGTVVRKRVTDNGGFEFGLFIVNPPPTLSKYIAHKQMVHRRRVLGKEV